MESGDHLVCECAGTRGLSGWEWRRWVNLDDRSRWAYEYEEGGKVRVGDRVEDFFAGLDRELCVVGWEGTCISPKDFQPGFSGCARRT